MSTTRTVLELLERSLRGLGVFDITDTIPSEDIQGALRALQDLIAAEAGSLMVPSIVQEAVTLVVAQTTYGIGEEATADLDTQRPEQIIGAFVRTSSDYDYPIKIIGEIEYRKILDKTTSGRPELLWYSPTSPNGTVYLYPVPDDATEAVYISSIKTLSEPSTLTDNLLDDVSIPRNYHNPLKWMLQLELCETYSVPPTPLMVKKDADARADIIGLNAARNAQPARLEIGVNGMEAEDTGNFLTF